MKEPDEAEHQLDLLAERESIKRKYDQSCDKLDIFSLQQASQGQKQGQKVDARLVPGYMRHITALGASLCLGGCAAIVLATRAFIIKPSNLHKWLHDHGWDYHFVLVATGFVCLMLILIVAYHTSRLPTRLRGGDNLSYSFRHFRTGGPHGLQIKQTRLRHLLVGRDAASSFKSLTSAGASPG